jgi:hypothetical protein
MSTSYSNIVVNGGGYTSFLPHQIKFVEFCKGLNDLKKTYNLTDTEVSITINGVYTYNNIIVSGPETNVYQGQNWSINWNTENLVPQNMSFTLKTEGSKHTDFGGGNRTITRRRRIKRKNKKQKTN